MVKTSSEQVVLEWDTDHTTASGTISGPRTLVVSNSAAVGIIGTITVGVMQAISDRVGATDPVIAWRETTDPQSRLKLAKQSSFAINNIQSVSSGEVVFSSNLGQIISYHPERGWRNIDIGDPRELTAISVPDTKNIIAEEKKGCSSHQQMVEKAGKCYLPGTYRSNFGYFSIPWRVFVLSLFKDDLFVHGTKNADTAIWSELKRIPGVNGLLLRNWPNNQGLAAIQNGKYMLGIPNGAFHVFDIASRTWNSPRSPGSFRGMRVVGNNLVHTLQTFRSPPTFTTDGGITWNSYENTCSGIYTWVMSFAVPSPNESYMLCFHTGAFVGSTSLHRTANGGKTWNESIKETPTIATQIYAADGFSFYADYLGNFHVSKDGGENWSKYNASQTECLFQKMLDK